MNHENQPRYTVIFKDLTAAGMDELVAWVGRDAEGDTFDAMRIEATFVTRGFSR